MEEKDGKKAGKDSGQRSGGMSKRGEEKNQEKLIEEKGSSSSKKIMFKELEIRECEDRLGKLGGNKKKNEEDERGMERKGKESRG